MKNIIYHVQFASWYEYIFLEIYEVWRLKTFDKFDLCQIEDNNLSNSTLHNVN